MYNSGILKYYNSPEFETWLKMAQKDYHGQINHPPLIYDIKPESFPAHGVKELYGSNCNRYSGRNLL